MRKRIDVDPTLDPVAFPAPILGEVYAHARESEPEECCGLITGKEFERYLAVARCRNDMTAHHLRDPERYPRDGREGFYMNERDYLNAARDAEARGETVTAVYHSHVDCGAYFSELDQEFVEMPLYPFPEADHLVVAVSGGKVIEQNLFRRDPESGRFVGRAVASRPHIVDAGESTK